MASIVDENGLQVDPSGEVVLTSEQIERTRDMIILRLRHKLNLSFESIGEVIGLHKGWVARRYNKIPEGARHHYGYGELV